MKKKFILYAVVFVFFSCESLKTALDSMGKSISEAANSGGSGFAKYDPDKRADPDAANWDIEKLDTAATADYLTGIEKDVILEMNKARSNPKKYAELYIQPKLKYYSGKNYSEPGQITIVTQEGAAAVNGCITALNRAGSAGILKPEKGLSLAAKDHVTDQSKTGRVGHDGSDKSTPETRMKRYGAFSGSWTLGENIDYGQTTGRNIVCALLIDDGVPSRGHRTNIMNKAFTQTGTAYGTHTQYRTSCTITYANGYASSGNQNSGKSQIANANSAPDNGSRVQAARPSAERRDTSKTDAELVAEAIKWGNCAFLYEYSKKEGADKQLVSQANAAIKRYTDLDSGTGRYRTNKMDPRVRQVPKDVMEQVFVSPETNLPPVVSSLVRGLSDQFSKAKVLHDWICDNIAYDTGMYFSGRRTEQDYVSVLKKKKAVCSGYANLFNKMCELAGIESIGIHGYSKGFGYTGKIGKNTDHEWNAVHIGNKWYLVDVTWDAGPMEWRTFIKHYSTAWLFLDARPFLYSHLPEDDAYQFYAPVLSADDFMREAYITGKFFQYGLALKSKDPEYGNIINGGFTFDLAMKNSNVSVSSRLRTPQDQNIEGAAWTERKGTTYTFDFDVPDTAEYEGRIFARYINVENPQFMIDIREYERDILPKVDALFNTAEPKDRKITEKELEYFKDSYFKVADNGRYYFAEDQFDTARNNAVLKIHKLIELSTGELEPILSFKIKAAPAYRGYGKGILKYPSTFSSYNQVSNTQLISPVTGTLKAGSSETFVISSKDYSSFAIIIDKEWNYFAKNSKTGNFELNFTVPTNTIHLQVLGGTSRGATHWGLVQYNVAR